jgi:hypothetical protein
VDKLANTTKSRGKRRGHPTTLWTTSANSHHGTKNGARAEHYQEAEEEKEHGQG